jgi:hypothetical protein
VSPVFLITLLLLAAIAYTIYRKQRQYGATPERELYPAPPRSLFPEGGEAAPDAPPAPARRSETDARAALVERASRGDLDALAEARRGGGAEVYRETLAALTRWAQASDENLRALAARVASDETLRGSVELSRAYSRLWESAPDPASTARALHLAALSDDAAEYGRVMEVAVGLRRAGRAPVAGDEELRALLDSEYWVMSSEARASGAAFVVKQQLAVLRAGLAARAPDVTDQ